MILRTNTQGSMITQLSDLPLRSQSVLKSVNPFHVCMVEHIPTARARGIWSHDALPPVQLPSRPPPSSQSLRINLGLIDNLLDGTNSLGPQYIDS
jgi:hypothetical protein